MMKKFIKCLLFMIIVNILILIVFHIFKINNIEIKWYALGIINTFVYISVMRRSANDS